MGYALAGGHVRSHGPVSAASPVRLLTTGRWNEALRNSDVSLLWDELHRLVRNHPLVCSSASAGFFEEGERYGHNDLTQELFTHLLSKQRFLHYLVTGMTDANIEFEISQIELSNFLTVELRKRHPESFRLARRISKLVQHSPRFQRFAAPGTRKNSYCRLANQVYGLKSWSPDKAGLPLEEAEQRVRAIPIWRRDTRRVGRSGDTQVIIGNVDLEKLIIAVLEAADTPCDVRNLRRLVMSRLPVIDIYLVPLGGGDDEEERRRVPELVDWHDNPEQRLMRREDENATAELVDEFLDCLRKAVRGKAKQYDRMVQILWRCYLATGQQTQLEVAAQLDVSDTLVSTYRHHIEEQLRALALSNLDQARYFELALRERVRNLAA